MSDDILIDFSKTFLHDVGTIEAGDGTCVRLAAFFHSNFGTREFAASYGCGPHDVALLVDYVPVAANDPSARDMDHWVKFPLFFRGMRVLYKPGLEMVPHM